MKNLFIAFVFSILSTAAHADMYKCAQMVYKDGWFRKYETLGNTWGANTKKHGVVSSLAGSSVEKTTSSVDPGVTTGNNVSTTQYSSSWGECSMLDYHITRQMRDDYIDQNMGEIKRQIALGEGYHVDSLAYISGCKGIERANWSQTLQKGTGQFYDIQNGPAFSRQIDTLINGSQDLKSNCHI